MLKDNSVVFKGRKDGIVIVLDKNMDFRLIKGVMRKKVSEASKFFEGAKAAIAFQGRELSEDEQAQLIEIIIKETNLDVSFVKSDILESEPAKPIKNTETKIEKKEEKSKVISFTEVGDMISAHDNNTVFHKGTLRSGQAIKHAGSVVVIGDVNVGAEIVAEGNIIILGSAKGLVHAGSTGNAECFISALNLIPTQLRIGEIITCIPEEVNKKNKSTPIPSYAYIQDNQIYIAHLV